MSSTVCTVNSVFLTVILPIILQPAIEVYTTGMTSCNSDSNTLQKND